MLQGLFHFSAAISFADVYNFKDAHCDGAISGPLPRTRQALNELCNTAIERIRTDYDLSPADKIVITSFTTINTWDDLDEAV